MPEDGVNILWRRRAKILRQMARILRIGRPESKPREIRTYAARLLERQRQWNRADPILACLHREFIQVRNRLFLYYKRLFSPLFREAQELHEDGPQILAEELINALDGASLETTDVGFRAYFLPYRTRAFRKILDLLEDKGMHISATMRAQVRAVKREANRIYTKEGRFLTDEEIERLSEGNSKKILELLNSKRVDLYYEDEDGNPHERVTDHLTPELLLILREEWEERERRLERLSSDTDGSSGYIATRIFWWNWKKSNQNISKGFVAERISSPHTRCPEYSSECSRGTKETVS